MESFNINLIPGRNNPVCHVSQYDKGRTIRVNLFEGSSVYTLTGAETVTANVRKPDGNIVTSTLTNTSDSYVEIITTEQMTACAGSNICELAIENGADLIGTLNFVMEVERSPLEGGIASQSEIYNLETQINAMVLLAVADQYDSANVIFDNAPTAGHGVPYTVTSDGLKTAIDAKPDAPVDSASGVVASFRTAVTLPLIDAVCEIPYDANGYTEINVTHCGKNLFSYDLPIHEGYWTGSSYTGSDNTITLDNATGWDNVRIPVAEGSTITISGMQAQSGVYSAFLGSDDASDVITRFLNASTNGTKTVPAGAKFLSLCAYNMKLNAPNYPNAQVEVGSLETAFEAYNGQTDNVSWSGVAGTIYGGNVDLTTGVLTVTYNADGTQKVTPDTYSLTPVVINQLNGVNNIFGDVGGQTSVRYCTSIAQDIVDIAEANLSTVAKTGSYNDLTNKPTFQNFTSLVTFNETQGGGTVFNYKDGAIYLIYQGEAKTHAANDLLFTLPSGYRPSAAETIIPCIKNSNAYGNIKITGTDGKCVVNTISANSGGRIYFNAVIVL